MYMGNVIKNNSLELGIALVFSKWKILIIRELLDGAKRNKELQRSIVGISQKMLVQCLRELEDIKVINKTVYPEIPPKVEYSLTDIGFGLSDTISALSTWSEEYKRTILKKKIQLNAVFFII